MNKLLLCHSSYSSYSYRQRNLTAFDPSSTKKSPK